MSIDAAEPSISQRAIELRQADTVHGAYDAGSVFRRGDVQDLGLAPKSYQIGLRLVVQERNLDEKYFLLAALHDRKAPNFEHFLTQPQYVAEFAATPATYSQALHSAVDHGFKITGLDPNRQYIDVTTTLANADRVFELQSHLVRQGVNVRHLQTHDTVIPKNMSALFLGVVGTSDVVTASPANIKSTARSNAFDLARAATYSRSAIPSALSGPIYGSSGAGVGPVALQNSYQLPVQRGYTGSGHTLAYIIDADPNQNDLALFLSYFQISRTGNFTRVNVNGGGGGFNNNSNSDSGEATLDYQTEASLAPGANVIEYSIPNLGFGNIYNALSSAVSQNVADAVSISIEGCENEVASSIDTSMNNILHQADMQGITVSAATGDHGLFKCDNGTKQGLSAPASFPDITAVGGTNAGAMGSSAPYTNQGGWTGSGGGYSAVWGRPAFQNYLTFIKSRATPDISLAADNGADVANDSAFLYFNGQPLYLGGTSWASPIFAAFQATHNQEQGTRRGFADPAMYAANQSANYTGDCLNDVTRGNNGSQAAGGWDYVTGLGSLYSGCSF